VSRTALHFLGAAREVTGSMHLIECEAGRILVDCGLYQGHRAEANQRNRELPQAALSADAVILTHAHIDHSGNLPTLVRRGFRGPIWATDATRDLAMHMLRDSARIQVGDAEWLNRQNHDDPNWDEITPLYDEDDARAALAQFRSVAYDTAFTPLPGVTARMLDAGHILGSAQVVLDLPDQGKVRRLILSGDLGRRGLPILRDPVLPSHADYVVMESTYGNRVHGSLAQMHDDLARVIGEAVKRGGKIVIPAFAVGRTQEVVYALHALHRAGRVPEIPIFVDSPLAVDVTEVFTRHPECYDDETAAFLKETGDAFHFSKLRYVESREESIRLNQLRGPAIIISASGMCEGGRVLHHLRNTVEDERNTIVIIGYMAQHTLGRRLLERRPRVRIYGVERDLHAEVRVLDAFSAHGDKHDLDTYARGIGGLRRLFLVHGEPDQQDPFAASLRAHGLQVSCPERGATEELG
jgi:metallo-beta-lactamase family protein